MKETLGLYTAVISSVSGIMIALINKNTDLTNILPMAAVLIGMIIMIIHKVDSKKNKDETRLPFEERLDIIKKHAIFFQLRKWIDFDIDRIEVVKCAKREWNVRSNLKILFKVILKGLNDEIDKFGKTKSIKDYEYWHNFVFSTIRMNYKEESIKQGVSPKYIEIFQTDFYRLTELCTIEGIATVIDNPLYDASEKLSAILDRFLWTLREIQNDTFKIINLNGRVDKALEEWEEPEIKRRREQLNRGF